MFLFSVEVNFPNKKDRTSNNIFSYYFIFLSCLNRSISFNYYVKSRFVHHSILTVNDAYFPTSNG
jgi:hypothetical protein